MARRRLPSRWIAALLATAVCCGTTGAAEATDRVGDLGAPDRLVIRGLEAINPERLRRPLVADFEVRWLARPASDRAPLLDALARKAEQALAAAGFATAQVGPAVETIEGTEKIVLDVAAGPRLEVGEIVVHGLDAGSIGRLRAFLGTPQYESSAIPERLDPPDGGTAVVWRGKDGAEAFPHPPAWPLSGPAPCDAASLRHIPAAVTRFLHEEGYLSIAAPRQDGERLGRGASLYGHEVRIDATIDSSDGRTAKLVLDIGPLPPPSRVSKIEIAGGTTTTSDALADFLAIRSGGPVAPRDAREWHRRLRESGRFLHQEVLLVPDLLEEHAVIARFELVDFPPMMPLSRPLSREEEALLRCRRWLLGVLADDRGLVVNVWNSPDQASSEPFPPLQLTLSRSQGFAYLRRGASGGLHGLVATPGLLRLMAPGGQGWFDAPLPPTLGYRLALPMRFDRATLDQRPDVARAEARYGLAFDIFGTPVPPGEPGFGLDIDIPPAWFLVDFHQFDRSYRWDGDTLEIDRAEGSPTRIHAPTGRLLSTGIAGLHLSIDQGRDTIAEAARIAASVGTARADDAHPASSGLRFCLGSDGLRSVRELAWLRNFKIGPTDLRRIDTDDPPPTELDAVLEGIASRCDDEAFATLDRTLARFLADAARPAADDLPIPATTSLHPTAWGAERLAFPSRRERVDAFRRHAAVGTWRLWESWFGHDAWPTRVIRMYAIAKLGGPYRDEVKDFLAARDHGPVAHFFAAVNCPDTELGAGLAGRGLVDLSLEAFRADCAPVMEAATTSGIVPAMMSVVRDLDDHSIRRLGGAFGSHSAPAEATIRQLQVVARSGKGGPQDALDTWWTSGISEVVGVFLRTLATADTATPTTTVD